jgi:hypothetical protein
MDTRFSASKSKIVDKTMTLILKARALGLGVAVVSGNAFPDIGGSGVSGSSGQ